MTKEKEYVFDIEEDIDPDEWEYELDFEGDWGMATPTDAEIQWDEEGFEYEYEDNFDKEDY